MNFLIYTANLLLNTNAKFSGLWPIKSESNFESGILDSTLVLGYEDWIIIDLLSFVSSCFVVYLLAPLFPIPLGMVSDGPFLVSGLYFRLVRTVYNYLTFTLPVDTGRN